MTFWSFARASFAHYRRSHAAVVLGVAGAVAVLAGSLLVGSSVRESLRALATARLGKASVAVAAEQPFTEQLGERLASAAHVRTAPVLALTGAVRHGSSGRRAGDVRVYGVDDRFFAFHGVSAVAPAAGDAWLSTDLASDLGAAAGDTIVLRVPRVTDIPLDSLHGRREDPGRSIRLTSRGVLSSGQMGSFSLAPGQGPVRAVFVSLQRLQRDLDLPERTNTLLVDGDSSAMKQDVRSAMAASVTPSDLGLRFSVAGESLIVDSASGLINDDLVKQVTDTAKKAGRRVTPVLTWLANQMTVNGRTVPYSLVTAIGHDAAGDAAVGSILSKRQSADAPIVLNEWAARDLQASPGEMLDLTYYRWADEGRLVTQHQSFRIAGIVSMSGLTLDQHLAPDYPGITNAADLSGWDPPFPIDLKLVRKQDEEYWDRYHTAPKAFIPIETGQSMWRTRHGQVSSLRISGADPLALGDLGAQTNGIRIIDVRTQNLGASAGATDFGAYFSYFSFFLMVSALLLAALFFRLSVEQRLPQIGVLRAAGFPVSAIRRLWLLEGGLIAALGAVAGALLAVAWTRLMMFALSTWWIGAVGTTELTMHVDAGALAVGAFGGAIAALVSLFFTVRAVSRSSPRAQIAGAIPGSSLSRSRAIWLAVPSLAAAVALAVAGFLRAVPAAGAFFGAGALVLIGGLGLFRTMLGSGVRARRSGEAVSIRSLPQLAWRNAAWRPGRSLTVAGLVASAVFLLVAVDSFRKSPAATGDIHSGTGGFVLLAQSQLPIVHDLRTAEGQEAAGISPVADAVIYPLRLRPGDDASCLNLYQPKQPRLLGIPPSLQSENRFRFAHVISSASGGQRTNPWTLLQNGQLWRGDRQAQLNPDAVVPAIVDQTSLEYVLHASVGDVMTIDAETSRPINLQFVASLDDSVLQGEILIDEAVFRALFPDIAGYRAFLIASPDQSPARVNAVATTLENGLEPFGFDAESTIERLNAFHRVENTYLSTFQALGGLGLVLGCLGLVAVVARNVFERRRELALLVAAGFTGRDLQRVIALEHLALVGAGLAIGVAAAAVAIGPVLIQRSAAAPWQALIWLVPVTIAGLAAASAAARGVRRLPIVASLRSE